MPYADKEKQKEYFKEWRKKNSKKCTERAAAWNKAHPKRRKEIMKKHRDCPELRNGTHANLGRKHNEEFKLAVSERQQGHWIGDKNPKWVGDAVAYHGVHSWVKRQKGKAMSCINGCTAKRYQWTNVDHKYRRNVDDYTSMCQSCHYYYDFERRKKMKETTRDYDP